MSNSKLRVPSEGPLEPSLLFGLFRELYALRVNGDLRLFNRRESLTIRLHQGLAGPGQEGVSREQLGDRIAAALRWSEAHYRFSGGEGLLAPNESWTLPNLVFRSVRCLETDEYVRSLLGPLGRRAILATDPFFRFQKLDLSPQEAYILSRIDAESTFENIMQISALPELDTLRALLAFTATGILEAVDAAQRVRMAAPEIRPEIEMRPKGQDGMAGRELLPEVSETLERLRGANYFEVLGVAEDAPADQIKQSYFALAKRYHPDKYHFTNCPELAEAGSQLFALVTQAYHGIASDESRARYVESIRRSKTGEASRAKPCPGCPFRRGSSAAIRRVASKHE